jgi:hypothetical protein
MAVKFSDDFLRCRARGSAPPKHPNDSRFRIWVRPSILIGIAVAVVSVILASSLKERFSGTNEAAGHFFEVEYTTAVKGLPHSKQLAFSRDVINPQDGHILCD